jgi:hypothetical protein
VAYFTTLSKYFFGVTEKICEHPRSGISAFQLPDRNKLCIWDAAAGRPKYIFFSTGFYSP